MEKTELSIVIKDLKKFLKINRNEIVNNLKEIVEIPSPSEYAPGTNEVGDFLIDLIKDMPFRIEKKSGGNFGNHVVAELMNDKRPRILFCGHMDTVFPIGSEWPFQIKNGRAFGPGVIDMKSGLILLIYALKTLHYTCGIPVGVKIFFNSDEEQGSVNSGMLLPELVKNIDLGIILEPAEPDGHIIVKRKGIGKFEVTVAGREAHAGKSPEMGINAILEIAHKIIEAQQLANESLGTTINTGFVNGGRSPYIVPASACALIESRVWTLDEKKRIEKGMKALEDTHFVKGTKIKVHGNFHRQPLIQLPQAGLLIESVSLAAAAIGVDINFAGSGAASDGNNLTGLGIPTIDGMGPVGGREHSPDEYLELETLFERTLLLAVTMLFIEQKFGYVS